MKLVTPFAIIVSTALLFACGKSEEAAAPVPPPVAETSEAEAVPAAPVEPAPPVVGPAPAEESASAQPEAAAPPAPKPAAPVAASKPEAATPAEAPTVAAPVVAPTVPAADLVHGQKIYRQACAFCHDRGVAGAPKTGDVATWNARLAKGMDEVYGIAIKGKGAMPPRGGNPSLSDADVNAAVDYMIAQSR